ncbi:MAG: alpha/beta fold hydrolase [Rubrobacteraceae bacterium]
MSEPLVFIPGLLCDERLWENQIEEFGDKYDISVADVSKDNSIEGMARRLLESSPERFALAGLSMG